MFYYQKFWEISWLSHRFFSISLARLRYSILLRLLKQEVGSRRGHKLGPWTQFVATLLICCKFYYKYYLLAYCVGGGSCTAAQLWKSEDSLWESVLSFHRVSSGETYLGHQAWHQVPVPIEPVVCQFIFLERCLGFCIYINKCNCSVLFIFYCLFGIW